MFITEQLNVAYEHGLGPIMNLTFVPYGNAKIDLDAKTVICQHGDAECDANTWESAWFTRTPVLTTTCLC